VINEKVGRSVDNERMPRLGTGWNLSFCASLSNLKRLVLKFVVSF
jgi:hypothetical protein